MTGAEKMKEQDVVLGQNGDQEIRGKEQDGKEIEVLKQMRAMVAKVDPTSENTDNATLLRFLRARSMCVPKASKMFAEHQKWRREYLPHGHALEDEIKEELTAGKYFVQGHDKKGRPIAVVLAANHLSGKKTIEKQKRAISYLMDKLICSMPAGEEKFVVISDLKDLKLKNLDFRGFISAFNFMQAYYPERLGKVYALHIPQVFWAFWKLVHPFLDDVTKAKISFVEDDKLAETLLKDISLEEIPTLYGGSKELVPLELAQPPGWPQFKPATRPVS